MDRLTKSETEFLTDFFRDMELEAAFDLVEHLGYEVVREPFTELGRKGKISGYIVVKDSDIDNRFCTLRTYPHDYNRIDTVVFSDFEY